MKRISSDWSISKISFSPSKSTKEIITEFYVILTEILSKDSNNPQDHIEGKNKYKKNTFLRTMLYHYLHREDKHSHQNIAKYDQKRKSY